VAWRGVEIAEHSLAVLGVVLFLWGSWYLSSPCFHIPLATSLILVGANGLGSRVPEIFAEHDHS